MKRRLIFPPTPETSARSDERTADRGMKSTSEHACPPRQPFCSLGKMLEHSGLYIKRHHLPWLTWTGISWAFFLCHPLALLLSQLGNHTRFGKLSSLLMEWKRVWIFMLRSKNHPWDVVSILRYLGSLKMERGTTACFPILDLQSKVFPEGKRLCSGLIFKGMQHPSPIQNPRPGSRESTAFNNLGIINTKLNINPVNRQDSGCMCSCPYPLRPDSHSSQHHLPVQIPVSEASCLLLLGEVHRYVFEGQQFLEYPIYSFSAWDHLHQDLICSDSLLRDSRISFTGSLLWICLVIPWRLL